MAGTSYQTIGTLPPANALGAADAIPVHQDKLRQSTPAALMAYALSLLGAASGLLKGNGTGGIAAAVAGTDYLTPAGSGAALTGITAAQVGAATTAQVQAQVQAQAGNYVADTGTVNALVVAPSPAVTVLTAGLVLRVKVANSTTGAATITVSGLSAVAIKWPDGTALQANDILLGEVAEVLYNGSVWQLASVTSATIQAQAGNYGVDTGSVNAISVTLSPAPASLTAGLPIRVKPAYSNTGATTLNVNGLGAVSIKKASGGSIVALAANDITAGALFAVSYDATANVFFLANAQSAAAAVAGWCFLPFGGSFLVPTGVTSIRIAAIGGGGSGKNGVIAIAGGTCGNAGTLYTGTVSVTPGSTVTVTIGAGGVVVSSGGNTTFLSTTVNGGAYGASYASGGQNVTSSPTLSIPALFTHVTLTAGASGVNGNVGGYGQGGQGGLLVNGYGPVAGTGGGADGGATGGVGGTGFGASGGGGGAGEISAGNAGNGAPGCAVFEWL